MPDVITVIARIVVTVFNTQIAGLTAYQGAAAIAIKAAAAFAASAIVNSITKGQQPDIGDNTDGKRDVNIRSGTEARKIVYGEALVGGVIVYSNAGGASNGVLTTVVANAGHEVSGMTDVYLDGTLITDAQIGAGAGANSGLNVVTAGDYYSATTSLGYVAIDRRTGSPTQTTNAVLNAQFGSDFDTSDRGRNIAYTLVQLSLYEISTKMFEAGAPRDYNTLVQGKFLYDPSADVSAGADMIANGFSSTTYKSYSTNPVLCAVDYLIDNRLGMLVSPNKIDWDEVINEAAFCDAEVCNSVTGERENRFTCNGILSTYDTHKTNLNRILSSCNGSVSYKNGKWFVKSGRFGQGLNLVSNGNFAGGDTGWTKFGTGTAGASSARMECIASATKSGRYQALTGLTVGSRYVVTGLMEDLSVGASSVAEINVTTAAGDTGTTLGGASNGVGAVDGNDEFEFIATGTTAYLNIFVNANAATTAYFDNVDAYLVAEKTVTADWLRDTIGVQTSMSKTERFNRAKAFYFSKDEVYKQIQSLDVTSAINLSRDNQEVLSREHALPMTNTEDEAQRLLYKQLKANERQVRLSVPCNYLALDVAVNDRLMVTIDELSYTNKVFTVEGWTLVDNQGGVDLALVEDDADYWRDPDTDDYSTRTATGALVPASPEVPPPTSVTLTARTGLPDMIISWIDPEPSSYYDYAQVYRATSNSFGAASVLVDIRANTYTDTTAVAGTTYYYWVRSRQGKEFSTEVATTPTNSVAAAIAAATATNVEWSGVLDGAGTIPSNNATVGAQLGTNVTDSGATSVGDIDALNASAWSQLIADNYNPYFTIVANDETPFGWYVGDQTGGPLARTALMGYEDSTNSVLHIKSGTSRPLILSTAIRLDKGSAYEFDIRIKAGASTRYDLNVYELDSALGSGIKAFCDSPTNADTEVGTASRKNTRSTNLSVSTSFGGGTFYFGHPYLSGGFNFNGANDVIWICFGIQRTTGYTDTDLYVDFAVVKSQATGLVYNAVPS